MIHDTPGKYMITIIKCPECHADSQHFKYDQYKKETFCSSCGLVLRGEPEYGVVYPSLYYDHLEIILVDLS